LRIFEKGEKKKGKKAEAPWRKKDHFPRTKNFQGKQRKERGGGNGRATFNEKGGKKKEGKGHAGVLGVHERGRGGKKGKGKERAPLPLFERKIGEEGIGECRRHEGRNRKLKKKEKKQRFF